MKTLDNFSPFYNEAIKLIDLNDFEGAINTIKKNFNFLEDKDDIALAYLNCGFINYKKLDYKSAIDDFSQSIYYEKDLDILIGRSKDIALSGRSNSRYKNGDYQGSIEDKRKAKHIRLLEVDKFLGLSNNQIDYKNILLETFINLDLEPKYKILIKTSRIDKSKYDLIEDYKKVIKKKRREEVIKELENLSESKYIDGDYKGAIKAIRRAEKYY